MSADYAERLSLPLEVIPPEDNLVVFNDPASSYLTNARKAGSGNPFMITRSCEVLVDVLPANRLLAFGRNLSDNKTCVPPHQALISGFDLQATSWVHKTISVANFHYFSVTLTARTKLVTIITTSINDLINMIIVSIGHLLQTQSLC